MTDTELLRRIVKNDPEAIHDFFFVRCKSTFTYIGQYFCDGMTAEEIIGEAYEVLSANDWHKLRIFKFSSSLVTYVSVIMARYFQHKRDREDKYDEEDVVRLGGSAESDYMSSFLRNDIAKALEHFGPLDRMLIQRILLDGDKPCDVMEDVSDMIRKEEGESFMAGHTSKQLSGYVYTRYSRVRIKFRNYMRGYGYEG